jgi:hypothetical protein
MAGQGPPYARYGARPDHTIGYDTRRSSPLVIHEFECERMLVVRRVRLA